MGCKLQPLCLAMQQGSCSCVGLWSPKCPRQPPSWIMNSYLHLLFASAIKFIWYRASYILVFYEIGTIKICFLHLDWELFSTSSCCLYFGLLDSAEVSCSSCSLCLGKGSLGLLQGVKLSWVRRREYLGKRVASSEEEDNWLYCRGSNLLFCFLTSLWLLWLI